MAGRSAGLPRLPARLLAAATSIPRQDRRARLRRVLGPHAAGRLPRAAARRRRRRRRSPATSRRPPRRIRDERPARAAGCERPDRFELHLYETVALARRPPRQQPVAAGAAGSDHQADVGTRPRDGAGGGRSPRRSGRRRRRGDERRGPRGAAGLASSRASRRRRSRSPSATDGHSAGRGGQRRRRQRLAFPAAWPATALLRSACRPASRWRRPDGSRRSPRRRRTTRWKGARSFAKRRSQEFLADPARRKRAAVGAAFALGRARARQPHLGPGHRSERLHRLLGLRRRVSGREQRAGRRARTRCAAAARCTGSASIATTRGRQRRPISSSSR